MKKDKNLEKEDSYKNLPDSAPIPADFQEFFNSLGNGAAKPDRAAQSKQKSNAKTK